MRPGVAEKGRLTIIWSRALNLPPPSSFLVVDQRDTAEKRLSGAGMGTWFSSENSTAHDNAVVFEDLSELSELDLVIEPGQVLGHGAPGWL